MKDLTKEILHYSSKFQISCPQFNVPNSCQREGGCVCSKYGEIYALIHSLIKPEYRKLNINSFTGTLPDGSMVLDTRRVNDVRKKIWTYLYGDIKCKPGLGRKDLNQLSVLDRRFRDGTNLIIHGDSHQTDRDGGFHVKKHVPMGKTLLASIVMIDAIYRRAYPSNKALTYEWMSFLLLRQLLKQKDSDSLVEALAADWLVIDDVDIIDKGDSNRASSWTKEVFDAFLIERMENRKPTILVCNFDITKIRLDEKMGAAFEKIVSSTNTHIVKV